MIHNGNTPHVPRLPFLAFHSPSAVGVKKLDCRLYARIFRVQVFFFVCAYDLIFTCSSMVSSHFYSLLGLGYPMYTVLSCFIPNHSQLLDYPLIFSVLKCYCLFIPINSFIMFLYFSSVVITMTGKANKHTTIRHKFLFHIP